MLRREQLVPPLTPWVGHRQHEALDALAQGPWVSLVGSVGAGKTRLAREVARAYGGDVLRVDVRPGESVGDLERRLEALDTQAPSLIIVDAADRAPAAARVLLPRWLAADPRRKTLVTTRFHLGVTAETTVQVRAMAPSDARVLFDRVRRSAGDTQPLAGYGITQALAALGHNPLAIEALARRVAALGPSVRVETAEDRLALTTVEGTLEAVARAAWNALPAPLQAWAASLATFVSPMSRADIHAVTELDDTALSSLVEHSVARRVGGDRLEVIPLLRDFAELHVPDDVVRSRHHAFFLGRVGAGCPWRELAAAASRSQERSEALDLWVGAAASIVHEGSARQALESLDRLWPENPAPRHQLARGVLSRIAGSFESSALDLEAALQHCDEPELTAQLECELATLRRHAGDPSRARAGYLAVLGRPCTQETTSRAHEQLGGLEFELGDLAEAAKHLTAAREGFARLSDRAGTARVEHTQGLLAQERGDLQAAEQAFSAAVAAHRSLDSVRFCAIARFDLGALQLERFSLTTARVTLELSLAELSELGDRRQVAAAHALLGVCARLQGDGPRAWGHLHQARAHVDRDDLSMRATIDIHEAHISNGAAPDVSHPSDEARYATRLRLRAAERQQRLVVIAEDGGTVDHPTRGRTLLRSDASRNILSALVAAFERSPDARLRRDDLILAGWPDRHRIDTAARNRLNVELSRLRKAGLHDQLQREGDSYHLTGPLTVEPSPDGPAAPTELG